MLIHLNNVDEEFDQTDLTISELMFIKQFRNKMMMVKLNGSIIKKNEWAATKLQHNDNLHIIKILSGG